MSGTSILIVICLLAISVYCINLGIKDNKEIARKAAAGQHIVEYLGGNPHIETVSSGWLKPRDKSLLYAEVNIQGKEKKYSISLEKIKSIELKTHEQITNDVTAGRLLLLGVFAFAAKKQNVHTKQYLVIHCEEEGVNYDMVFTGEGMGTLASRINGALIAYRKSKHNDKAEN